MHLLSLVIFVSSLVLKPVCKFVFDLHILPWAAEVQVRASGISDNEQGIREAGEDPKPLADPHDTHKECCRVEEAVRWHQQVGMMVRVGEDPLKHIV